MPNWRNLNPNDGPNNCQRAMEVAEKHFKIPMVSVNYMLSVIRCGLNWELFKINVLDSIFSPSERTKFRETAGP